MTQSCRDRQINVIFPNIFWQTDIQRTDVGYFIVSATKGADRIQVWENILQVCFGGYSIVEEYW